MASNKLDLKLVLHALDKRDLQFYSKLSDEDKKQYAPYVLLQFMSSVTDQSDMAAYAALATNDLVNIGFWNLSSKHTELLHLLLCITGLGNKQYRPWLAIKKGKNSNSVVDGWLLEQHPDLNEDELNIIKDFYDLESWTELVKSSGESDQKVKELVKAWKK
jgi:hypothetical protein